MPDEYPAAPATQAPGMGADEDTQEVGVIGDDLPFWRAREAVRHAEIKLSGQTVAMQALEGRATSVLGWSVAGLLALGAAIAGGAHIVAASLSALCLFLAAILCVTGILARDFNGVPGYEPAVLLGGRSQSEYAALVALAAGYQLAVDRNHAAFRRFRAVLHAAIVLMCLAPVSGFAALLLLQPYAARTRLPIIRAAEVWAECAPVLRFSGYGCVEGS